MKSFYSHLKTYTIRGLLAVIPIVLTILVLQFLYVNIDRRIMRLIGEEFGFNIPGLGLLILFALLYFLGLTASNVVGRRFFSLVERITTRIPLVKSFYQVGKQIAQAFSLPETSAFKQAVFIEYLTPGQWTLGFVTGSMTDRNTGEQLLRVYIPTPPIPTSGVMVIVQESKTRDPGITIEEAFRIIMSGGIVGPEYVKLMTRNR